jgi:hypothetical protein
MKPATASADNGTSSVPEYYLRPEGISIRFRPEDTLLKSPFGPAYFMKPATASADNGTSSVPEYYLRPEGISIRFRPEDTLLKSPFGPEQSPLSALSPRSFMKNAGQSIFSPI